jgi:hypothetical protein
MFSGERDSMRSIVYWTLVVWASAACVCSAAPEPAIVQGPDNWTVDVRFEHVQQIVLPGGSRPMRFWYTIVTLTNKTDEDVDFYPKCELVTDAFQIMPAGKGVLEAVFRRIKRRHQSKYPFLESLERAGNKILQGEDNAKDIAIIWPDFDAQAKNIKIFISGLSDETAVVDHPVARDETGQPKKVYLRKTLELNYALGGDPALRSFLKLTYKGRRWIMR